MRIVDILFASMRRYSECEAISNEIESISYRELFERTERLATMLQKRFDIVAGSHVAIWSPNCAEFIEAIFAANMLGAIVEPYNTLWPASMAESLLREGNVAIAFVQGSDRIDAVTRTLGEGKVFAIGADSERVPRLNRAIKQWDRSYVPFNSESNDEAFNLFTSGTTGVPKCVVHTNGSIMASELVSGGTGHYRPNDKTFVLFPLFHIGGLQALSVLMGGATIVFPQDTTAEHLSESICKLDESTCTLFFSTVIVERLLRYKESHLDIDMRSVNWILYGGASMNAEILKRCKDAFGQDVHFSQGYGSTEAGPICVELSPIDHLDESALESVGYPNLGCYVRIETGDGTIASGNENGEILLRSSSMMKGYRNRPELTAEVFRGGWYHTHDEGYLDERGMLHISGRIDDMIISGGENIFPEEVRGFLLSCNEDVADAAVIGVEDDKWGQALVAFVILKDCSHITEMELRIKCGEALGHYKRPKRIYFVNEIPRNAIGKVTKLNSRLLDASFSHDSAEDSL